MPTTKPWYQSKTVWFNIITTVAAILDLANKQAPASLAPWILFGTGIVNVILRIWFVSQPIA